MNTVHVVLASCGDYDAYTESIHGIYESEEQAVTAIDKADKYARYIGPITYDIQKWVVGEASELISVVLTEE